MNREGILEPGALIVGAGTPTPVSITPVIGFIRTSLTARRLTSRVPATMPWKPHGSVPHARIARAVRTSRSDSPAASFRLGGVAATAP